MPGAWLGVNKVTGKFLSVTSWKTTEDPAPGPYAERMDPDGSNQYVLLYNNSEVYWRSGLWNGQYFGAVPGTREKTAFMFRFVDGEVWKYATYTITVPSMIFRFVIDSLGQGKGWLWLNSSQQWQQIFTIPFDHCDVPSLCGAFAVCDQKSSSLCSCYTGFQPASPPAWNSGDWVSGCVRRTHLQCSRNISNGGEQDGFLEMQNVKLPSNPQSLMVSGDLRSLQQLNDGDAAAGSTLHLRLAASDLPSSRSSHKWVLAVILSAVAALVLIFFAVLGAARKLNEGDVLNLLDENLAHEANMEELARVCKVACWCIQENEAHRPLMGLAVLMLEGLVEVNLAPIPSLLLQLTEDQSSSIYSIRTHESETSSQ
ncbi:hypothetical protein J5N97_027182 [Dioscorea zingiberensis]|uniref:S-locus glycoprotein domain-containing protein n=1 Tax=Dioscorea zingiberensis TaxID=325984 RepID=A0A9D5C4T2_9LILI|nr:hypothetical protein J5N97_027182 [Dioscorea zingiberensis]